MDLKPLFVFPRWSNKAVLGLIVFLMGFPLFAGALVTYGLDPVTLNSNYQPVQPIPYSHALHVGQLGLDCRYCHNTVEKADFAAVPPTETCMNCHISIRSNSPLLKPLRESYGKKLIAGDDPAKAGKPVPWVRVHDLPDYVFFNHSAHVNAAISCVECHGNIDRMETVYQKEPLNMAWCVQCHRAPEAHIRPRDKVFDLEWKPDVPQGKTLSQVRFELGKQLKDQYHINPSTDCVTCHR
jgi:menaquinone reductase, multiheme cytochrome c subunit